MKTVLKYEKKSIKLAAMLDALAHPARLKIIQYLSEHECCPAGNISDHLPVSKSTVSRHMSKLKNTGLIFCKPRGICLDYQLNERVLTEFKNDLFDFFKQIDVVKSK